MSGNLSSTFATKPYSVITSIWNKIIEIKSRHPQSGSPTPSVLSRSLASMAPTVPFLYQLFMAKDPNTLPGALFDLTQHCHKWDRSGKLKHEAAGSSGSLCPSPNDLWSLYYPVYEDLRHTSCRDKSCGGYLEPLTVGASFSPYAASAYLSWMAYLTDDLYISFNEMLDEFKNIDCSKSGCNDTCNGRHSPGQHGTTGSNQCSCTSVVSCAGVLPLLYRYGFQFYRPYSLSGGRDGSGDSKRSCQKFHTALSNVLSPDAPLAKLLESIDSFLYLFRIYFFYNLSSFWLCSLLILLYFIFYGIDVLHFKSHVHFPSSHKVPPIAPLTTGKAADLTKLSYYMP
ncbi:uncharacterized protein BcabD6B2_14370 [Babesia caballi]|uniref:Uncharacterized protein n=1 Tax=Babesia caballi TaxID=5871 RepID=A0AAV4LP08_BABCB|nr:hypothetical protein, conserved [Babesia caballi]